ncbi:MAG: T9SS type A sorting domain-containing protein [Candidatus Kapabacteria bacterium]|nr:T9SS type A sorting domain-containing protein [Candidatus Kapabacteria bacterium]
MRPYFFVLLNFILINFNLFSQNDTINDYYIRSSGFRVYTYEYNNVSYPLTGSNNMYFMLGSKFVFSGQSRLAGVLIAFAEKKVVVDDLHQIIVYHLNPVGDMPTGQAIGVGEFKLSQCDTNSINPVFTWLPIEKKPAYVNSNFGVMIHTRTRQSGDDYLSVFTNLQGDGQLQKTCFDMYIDNQNNWVYENLYDFPIKPKNITNPDIDLMMIPVLDFSTDVESELTLNGFVIKKVFPNPVDDVLNIELGNDELIDFTISIFNINGEKLVEYSISNSSNNISIDTKNLSEGSYIFLLSSKKGNFGGKFIIKR